MHQTKVLCSMLNKIILPHFFSFAWRSPVKILHVLSEWKYPACGLSWACRPTSAVFRQVRKDCIGIRSFPFPWQECNCLIVFTMTATIWCCTFEYVKHSVCQSLMEIQSDHVVGGALEGKPADFKSHLPSICCPTCCFPGPQLAVSLCVCLKYEQ